MLTIVEKRFRCLLASLYSTQHCDIAGIPPQIPSALSWMARTRRRKRSDGCDHDGKNDVLVSSFVTAAYGVIEFISLLLLLLLLLPETWA